MTGSQVVNNGSLQTAAAEPNISRNGEPIKFVVKLGQPAKVTLTIFSLVGEVVYQESLEGASGANNLLWNLDNQAQESIASGLYLYLVQVNDGTSNVNATGKVVVIR
jgi:hypothetical protein